MTVLTGPRPAEMPIETAVVVPLRGSAGTSAGAFEMDELFQRWRVDEGQSNPGMPMHVTLMAPFIDIAELDQRILDTLIACLKPWPAFECQFRDVRLFPGPPRRAWLAPEPAEVFVSMTHAVMAAFPGLLPYGGEHDGIVPHVSVAKERDAASFEAAVARVEADLPLHVRAGSIEIYSLGADGWELETSWDM